MKIIKTKKVTTIGHRAYHPNPTNFRYRGLIRKLRRHPLLFFVIFEVIAIGVAVGLFVILDKVWL